MTGSETRRLFRILSLSGLAVCCLFGLWAWQSGLLTSREAMAALFCHACSKRGSWSDMTGGWPHMGI